MAEAATRYGFAGHVTDWQAIIADDRIGLFDNVGPNDLHAAPTIAAAEPSETPEQSKIPSWPATKTRSPWRTAWE